MSKNGIRILFVLTILSVFLFTGSAILFAEDAYASRNGRVNTASVNIRSGPGTTYSKIGSVKKGMKLEIIAQKSGWYKIKVWKLLGWVKNDFVSTNSKVPVDQGNSGSDNGSGGDNPDPADVSDSVNDSSAGKHLVIKATKVNVRSGAGTNYPVITQVSMSEKYEVVRRQGDWYEITLSDGKRGWVAGWVTEVIDSPLPSRGDTDTPEPQDPDNNTETPGQDQNDNGDNAVIKLTNLSFDISEPGAEKVVITGSDRLQYSISPMTNPARLVIDIKNCEVNDLKDVEAGGTILQNIRISQYSVIPMAVRIVLDLNKTADYVPLVSGDGTSLRIVLSEPSIDGKVIVIDPGHGGWDNGATGVTGLKEKDVNLDTALKLRDKLTALGATVIMTREDDTFISLTERSRIANDAKADVFVSVHANANVNPAVRGTSTYYYTVTQPVQRERLARIVQKNMAALLGIRDIGILEANFAVLRETNMPSILVESAFLSNAEDEQLLRKDEFRDKVASGIAEGLTEFFGSQE